MTTERAALPELVESQAGAYITINEAFRQLEALLVGGVLDKDLTAPPGSPGAGDVYIVGPSATGDWAGQDNNLAHYYNGSWHFYVPATDLLVWVSDESRAYRYNGATWDLVVGYGGKLYKSITGNETLTDAESDADIIEIYGTLSADATIEIPVKEKLWVVYNGSTGGYSVNLKTIGGAGQVLLQNGNRTIVYCDGTNITSALDSFPYGITIGGVINPPLYSVASVPDATQNYGAVIAVTDGDAGSLCLAVSDGANWMRVSLGTAISTT